VERWIDARARVPYSAISSCTTASDCRIGSIYADSGDREDLAQRKVDN